MAVPPEGRSGIAYTAALATHELRKAEKLERRRPFDPVDAHFKAREAAQSRADGERLLEPLGRFVGDASTEIVPAITSDVGVPACRLTMICTLDEPNTISIDASEHRAAVATRAGVLSPALDAAVTVGARNSIEKMLAHQIAAVHMIDMEIIVRLREEVRLPPVELARLTNAAARLFEVSQTGALAIQKLKLKGRQRVIVQHQHVTVTEGGRAVVAGRVDGASRRGKAGQNGR